MIGHNQSVRKNYDCCYHLVGGADVAQSEEQCRARQIVKPYQVLSSPKPGKNMLLHNPEMFINESSEIRVKQMR